MEPKTKDFFSKDLITIQEWETPENGLKVMKNNFIRHLPVVDSKTEEIVGIVSDRDLIAEMANPDIFIRDVMSKKVLSFDLHSPLKRIVDEMIDLKVSSFLIKDNGRYCGIITTEDMMQVLSMVLADQDEPLELNLIPFYKVKYPNAAFLT